MSVMPMPVPQPVAMFCPLLNIPFFFTTNATRLHK